MKKYRLIHILLCDHIDFRYSDIGEYGIRSYFKEHSIENIRQAILDNKFLRTLLHGLCETDTGCHTKRCGTCINNPNLSSPEQYLIDEMEDTNED